LAAQLRNAAAAESQTVRFRRTERW